MPERKIPHQRSPRGWYVRAPHIVGEYQVEIDETDRQMICLALATQAGQCPGWHDALRRIAAKLPDGERMFSDFWALEVQKGDVVQGPEGDWRRGVEQ